jgi:hypothetical protein
MPGDATGDLKTPAENLAADVKELRNALEDISAGLTFRDFRSTLGGLVGANGLRSIPVHRWYYYKEGFSPLLPPLLVDALGTGDSKTVVDTFAGVATTALSLRSHDQVARAIGVEYSPFAQFVGQTKLSSFGLDDAILTAHAKRLAGSELSRQNPNIPQLAAFRNPEIFDPKVIHDLVAIRDLIRDDTALSDAERAFFLLGIAGVTEDLSCAMKDGRALRILRGRKRRHQGLRPPVETADGPDVQSTVTNQWLAMIEDLADTGPTDSGAKMLHVNGDARDLSVLRDDRGADLLPPGSVGLHLYSPPYLNCIDYTEVYKIELWLLEFVSDHARFRQLREGTLRSHPSIEFANRPSRSDRASPVFGVIDSITEFLTAHIARASLGRVHGYYFADMEEVLHEQYRTLEPGGAIACVVANSTFSRRIKEEARASEIWRIPILTDVLIARLAEAVGFSGIEIWVARDLQAKNVSGGLARESIVIARKPVLDIRRVVRGP